MDKFNWCELLLFVAYEAKSCNFSHLCNLACTRQCCFRNLQYPKDNITECHSNSRSLYEIRLIIAKRLLRETKNIITGSCSPAHHSQAEINPNVQCFYYHITIIQYHNPNFLMLQGSSQLRFSLFILIRDHTHCMF